MTEIPLKNNTNYKRVLFKVTWNKNPRTTEIRKRLQDGLPIYLVYDNPWFWKIIPQNIPI